MGKKNCQVTLVPFFCSWPVSHESTHAFPGCKLKYFRILIIFTENDFYFDSSLHSIEILKRNSFFALSAIWNILKSSRNKFAISMCFIDPCIASRANYCLNCIRHLKLSAGVGRPEGWRARPFCTTAAKRERVVVCSGSQARAIEGIDSFDRQMSLVEQQMLRAALFPLVSILDWHLDFPARCLTYHICWHYFRNLIDVVEYLHSVDVAHQDIKI